MKTIKIKAVAPLALVALLGGCQAFATPGQQSARVEAEDVDLSSYFAQRLAEARRHLDANRPAAAVTAFRQASYDPALRAEAYNGMAIAYDRIGRTDLAGEYFIAALRLDPENARFSTNLALFGQRQLESAETRQAMASAEAGAARLAEESETAGALAMAGEPGRMQRTSAREVHIAASSAEGQAAAASASERPAVIHVGRSDRASVQGRAGYPIRVDLASAAASEDQAAGERAGPTVQQRIVRWSRLPGPRRASRYPVRIALSGSAS